MFLSNLRLRNKYRSSVLKDQKGVAAMEFALIAPILVVLLLGSVDAVFALTAKRKVALATQSVADLAARESDVDRSDLDAIAQLGRLILTPFDVSQSRISVAGIRVDGTGRTATVEWSRASGTNATAPSAGTQINLQSPLGVGTFLVFAETELPYRTILGFLENQTFGNRGLTFFTLADDAYFQARNGTEVTCSDC